MDDAGEIRLWFWEYTDEFGKRRRSTWRMTEDDAKDYKDAVKIESTLEIRSNLGRTGDLKYPPRRS